MWIEISEILYSKKIPYENRIKTGEANSFERCFKVLERAALRGLLCAAKPNPIAPGRTLQIKLFSGRYFVYWGISRHPLTPRWFYYVLRFNSLPPPSPAAAQSYRKLVLFLGTK